MAETSSAEFVKPGTSGRTVNLKLRTSVEREISHLYIQMNV